MALADIAAAKPPVGQEAETVAKPPPAVPLVATPPASAEPAGPALEGEDDNEGPSTAETAVVAAPPPVATEVASPGKAPEQQRPRADRAGEAPPDWTSGPAAERAEPARASREEPSPLGPATAAGARPRYPPPPAVAAERGAPVGAAARVSSAASLGGAPTMRRERRPDGDQAGDGAGRSSSHSPIRLAIIAAVLVGAIILVATLVLSGGGGKGPAGTLSTHSSGPAPANVTVAVLNGTHESGLATRVSETLSSEGYKRGAIGNAPSQDHTSTLVGYTPGNREAAIEVALALALTTTQVVPADPATEAAASHAGVTPAVVVTLGSNYAQQ